MAFNFDGNHFAQKREEKLAEQLALVPVSERPQVAAILFTEDQGSVLYTRLKKEAAERVGIGYSLSTFSMREAVEVILAKIAELNVDPTITGIIIQKPWRNTWTSITNGSNEQFGLWWRTLTEALDLAKDVDGLHPQTLAAIKANTWKEQGYVMPATAKAVLSILEHSQEQGVEIPRLTTDSKIIILGKSDILGQPLFYELKNHGYHVEMIGSLELATRVEQGKNLLDADVVISSTGHQHLITGQLIKESAIVIDVGEPRPDVEAASVEAKASFLTPVPGGVGPVTVVSLLENAVELS